ncbi:unnamed protein product [Choristocarpus tenellus]
MRERAKEHRARLRSQGLRLQLSLTRFYCVAQREREQEDRVTAACPSLEEPQFTPMPSPWGTAGEATQKTYVPELLEPFGQRRELNMNLPPQVQSQAPVPQLER